LWNNYSFLLVSAFDGIMLAQDCQQRNMGRLVEVVFQHEHAIFVGNSMNNARFEDWNFYTHGIEMGCQLQVTKSKQHTFPQIESKILSIGRNIRMMQIASSHGGKFIRNKKGKLLFP